MSQTITKERLAALAGELRKNGTKVGAPVAAAGKTFYRYLDDQTTPLFDPRLFAVNSIKEFFFPRHEILYTFERIGKDVLLEDAKPFDTPQVVFAARPCDAAALPLLDHVFGWDFQDRFYQQRRAMTTVVTLACAEPDPSCFCTSVGLAPSTTAGADAVLLPIEGEADTFEVRCVTEKGKKLFEGKTSESDKTGSFGPEPARRFDLEELKKRLREQFDHPAFAGKEMLHCVGCGACTYLCPTCHCFDMVDEGTVNKGRKVKNWDSCQFALFTHHASGHNPRHDQGERQRQRIQHKFAIYPEKFGVILCTGCGNCMRGCVGGLGIRPVLEAVARY